MSEHILDVDAVEIGTELEHVPSPPPALFGTDDPAEVIKRASVAATALAAVINDRKLYTSVQGKNHVHVEGWTLMGAMLGVTAVCVATEEVDGGFKATVEARTADGRVVGRADALCTKYEKRGPWKNADDYARLSMAQCVPWRAEILTRDGFRRFTDIKPGVEVLAYDPEWDRTVWTKLEAINVFADEPVVRMRSRSFDFTCTPNHSWVVRREINGRTAGRLVEARGLDKGSLVLAAPCVNGGDLDTISNRDAAIVGWLLTDGTLRYPQRGGARAHIDQSKPNYVDALMERTGLRSPADGPRIATQLNPYAREAMLDAMLKADGSRKRQSEAWRFGKLDPHVMETFQVLATLTGRALGRMTGFSMTTGAWMPTQVLRANRLAVIKALTVEDAGRESVWCPTTQFGTWVMRLDGNVSITGNTRATSKALKGPLGFIVSLAGYATTPSDEMTFAEPDPVPSAHETARKPITDAQRAKVAEALAATGLTVEDQAVILGKAGFKSVADLKIVDDTFKVKQALVEAGFE